MRPRWIALLAVAVAGCESLLGVDFDNVKPSSELDGGTGAVSGNAGQAGSGGQAGGGGGSAGAGGQVCQSIQPEPEPSASGAGGDVEVTVVLRDPHYGDDELSPGDYQFDDIGFDLDHNCTNRGDPPLCLPPSWTEGDPSDGARGQDNAIGAMLVSQIVQFGPVITSTILSESIDSGVYAPPALLRVRGYSGFAEDDAVEVEWFVPLPASEAPGGGFVPAYDGSDAWPLDDDYVTTDADAGADAASNVVSVIRATRAYVNRSQLVAYFDSAQLPLANVYFEIRDIVVTGLLRLVPGTQRFELANGTLAGQSPADSILAAVPRITRAVQGVEVCTDSFLYPDIKKFVCEQADMMLAGSGGTDCDSMSFAAIFDGQPALVGDPVRRAQSQPFCQQADPADDSCANAP